MKHLIVTLIIIFTFFSMSNAYDYEEDTDFDISDFEMYKRLLLYNTADMTYTKNKSTITVKVYDSIITSIKFKSVINKYICSNTDTGRRIRSYYAKVHYIEARYKVHVANKKVIYPIMKCKADVSNEDGCYEYPSYYDCEVTVHGEVIAYSGTSIKFDNVQKFKTDLFSGVYESAQSTAKRHDKQTIIERRNGFIDADEIANYLLTSSK